MAGGGINGRCGVEVEVYGLWVLGFGGSCNGGFWCMVWWIVVMRWFGLVESCDDGTTVSCYSFLSFFYWDNYRKPT